MEVNEQKRQKFMENAGKRVNNVMHNIQILEPMARSNVYDFTKEDVEEMFSAMQETLDGVKQEFYRKFEGKARSERKSFVFGQNKVVAECENNQEKNDVVNEENVEDVSTESVDVIDNNVENNEETVVE